MISIIVGGEDVIVEIFIKWKFVLMINQFITNLEEINAKLNFIPFSNYESIMISFF